MNYTILIVELGICLWVGLGEKLLGWRAEEANHLGEASAVGKLAGSRSDTTEDVDIGEQFPHLEKRRLVINFVKFDD